ncbi:hypothetical protein [Amycolatopsis ultiminotia]|uniref:WD40/YVTN/BNR-like repeat-containing protein n=1 Tax=Amycolatopsis ultiminotia TaxID=543629 RepID=UPI0031ECE19A
MAVVALFSSVAQVASGSSVPGFAPASTSWTSPQRGFVLGYSRCAGSGWCPRLLGTDDAGVHWRALGAPPMSLPDNHNHVRLVAAGGTDLYVTDGTDIVATRDGGRRWFPVQLPGAAAQRYVAKIVEHGGRSFVLVTGHSGDTETTTVHSGPAGSPVLQPLPGFSVQGGITYGDLAVRGGLQIVLDADYRTEFYWTSHDGVRFTTAPAPCPEGSTASLGGVRDGQVLALCSSSPGSPQPGSSQRKLYRAPRLGETFRATAEAPTVGITQAFDAATADSATVAAEGGGDGFLHRTTDGGRTWRTTVLSERGVGLWDLDFPDGATGVVVDGLPDAESGSAVYRTTDGGRTWAPLALA